MSKVSPWIHALLEAIGVLTLLAGLGCLGFYWLFLKPMANFAGGNCSDTGERITQQPDGSHTIKSFYRQCGPGSFSGYFVYLSTGNQNKGYEYTPIIELDNLTAGSASAAWDDTNHLAISYPSSAAVVDAYAKIFGISIELRPTSRGK